MGQNPNYRESIKFTGRIHLIASNKQLAEVDITKITSFGFDTETKPAFKKGESFKTALLQLATDTDAYLIRMHYLNQFHSIKEIFENPEVLKVGAAIAHDLKELQKLFTFQPKGFVDIQKIAKEKGLKNLGLKKMTEEVFGAHLYKGPKMTNWERQVLTEEQLLYAATDAWIGLELYRKLSDPTAPLATVSNRGNIDKRIAESRTRTVARSVSAVSAAKENPKKQTRLSVLQRFVAAVKRKINSR